jgi:hypothetical protein
MNGLLFGKRVFGSRQHGRRIILGLVALDGQVLRPRRGQLRDQQLAQRFMRIVLVSQPKQQRPAERTQGGQGQQRRQTGDHRHPKRHRPPLPGHLLAFPFQYIPLRGDLGLLALKLPVGDTMTRQNDVADAVRRLRQRIQAVLLEQADIRCGRGDVVSNDRRYGYRLTNKIRVRDADDVRNDADCGAGDVRNDVKKEPNDVRTGPDDVRNPSARQEWILAEIGARGELRKDEVFPGYKRQFGLSKTTLERDLNALRRRGAICFDGEKRTGRWRRA